MELPCGFFLGFNKKCNFNTGLFTLDSLLVTSSNMIIVTGEYKDKTPCIKLYSVGGMLVRSLTLPSSISCGGSAEVTRNKQECLILAYNAL